MTDANDHVRAAGAYERARTIASSTLYIDHRPSMMTFDLRYTHVFRQRHALFQPRP